MEIPLAMSIIMLSLFALPAFILLNIDKFE